MSAFSLWAREGTLQCLCIQDILESFERYNLSRIERLSALLTMLEDFRSRCKKIKSKHTIEKRRLQTNMRWVRKQLTHLERHITGFDWVEEPHNRVFVLWSKTPVVGFISPEMVRQWLFQLWPADRNSPAASANLFSPLFFARENQKEQHREVCQELANQMMSTCVAYADYFLATCDGQEWNADKNDPVLPTTFVSWCEFLLFHPCVKWTKQQCQEHALVAKWYEQFIRCKRKQVERILLMVIQSADLVRFVCLPYVGV